MLYNGSEMEGVSMDREGIRRSVGSRNQGNAYFETVEKSCEYVGVFSDKSGLRQKSVPGQTIEQWVLLRLSVQGCRDEPHGLICCSPNTYVGDSWNHNLQDAENRGKVIFLASWRYSCHCSKCPRQTMQVGNLALPLRKGWLSSYLECPLGAALGKEGPQLLAHRHLGCTEWL